MLPLPFFFFSPRALVLRVVVFSLGILNYSTDLESVGEPGQSGVKVRMAQRSSNLKRKKGTK